jgi:hypothetical protein
MMAQHSKISADDVLRAFAMDFDSGADVLKRYLAEYPEHSAALVDLSRELMREFDDEILPGFDELALVSAGIARLKKNATSVRSLRAAPVKVFTDAIKVLSLPIQVGIAFRERRIEAASLPHQVLAKLAEALQTSTDTLLSFLALPTEATVARARKSAVKPAAPEKVPFERVLRDAGVDDQRISSLLHEE